MKCGRGSDQKVKTRLFTRRRIVVIPSIQSCAEKQHSALPAFAHHGNRRERAANGQTTCSTILPTCVLDSISACAWAAWSSGKVLKMTGLILPVSSSGQTFFL